MSAKVLPLVEFCHFILPVCPERVKTVEFVPEVTVFAPLILPETEGLLMSIAPDTLLVWLPFELVTAQ